MKRLPLLLLLALAPSFALAQTATRVTDCSATTPNNAVCITWGAVTTRTDGLPTMLPVTYRVEQALGTGAFSSIATVSTTEHYVQNLAPGAYTFRVFALENALASAASASGSRTVAPPPAPPRAPVITIAVVISPDAPPTNVTVNGDEVYASTGPTPPP